MNAYKILINLMLFLMLSGANSAFSETALAEDPGWPRLIEKNGKELVIYQPQVDFWKDYKEIRVRFAFSVKDGKSQQETFGVAQVDADTVVDQEARVVAVIPKNRDVRFPNTTDKEAAALQAVVEELHPPNQSLVVSLDRVLTYLDPAQQPQQQPVDLNLDPPKVFYSDKTAILVMFMGEPQLQPIVKDNNDLMIVANTNWYVFYDTPGQKYYLLNQESWLTTADVLNGPWTPTTTLPTGLSSLPADDYWNEVRANIPGKANDKPPIVFTSKEPAELILTDGAPTYSPIPGTKLMRITNTDTAVFLNSGDGKYYFLTAGRWFRAASLAGPWSTASNDLPAEFANIPDDDPAAFVKASVPGTTEAKDAVLLASIPTTTALDVSKPAEVQVTYDGQPKFQTIPSTTVQYAPNASNEVFLLNGSYYCCIQGVWYFSSNPNGPWMYCTNVPAAIYTIPPSHPTHHVTYVTVQSSTPTTVVYAQTAGYSGEYVAANGVLMFGAGMIVGAIIADNHDDYYYGRPYPVPYSYGYGARYNYAYGGYYRGAQVSYGPYRGAGAGAAYNPATGTYARGAYAYGPGGSVSRGQAYNPYTGARAAGSRVDTAYGSAARGAVYNPNTGTRAAGSRVDTAYGSAGRGAAYNPNTGTAVRGGYRSNEYGTVAGGQSNRGSSAVAWNTENSQGAVVKGKNNNVYAGKDGNVYKKDSDGNWSSNTGGSWAPVEKPQPSTSQAKTQQQVSTTQTSSQTSRTQAQQQPRSSQTTQNTRKMDSQAQQRPSTTQPKRTQAQPKQTSSQVSQNKTRDLESQAQARSRGNQLSQQSRSFQPSGSGSRPSREGGSRRR